MSRDAGARGIPISSDIDKVALLEALCARVRANLDSLRQSQAATQAGATHSEARAEGPKDTRATETSYLARGLAERVEELEGDLAVLSATDVGAARERAGVGSLVTLEDEAGTESHYFILPAGAGETLDIAGLQVRTLTPHSPLGRQLIGREAGDEIVVARPRGTFTASVERIH